MTANKIDLILRSRDPQEVLREIQREAGRKSFFYYAKHILEYSDLSLNTHLEICHTLQSDCRKKLICVPRGTFKSTLACVAFPTWLLTYKNPNLRILIDSEIYSNSAKFLREIKAKLKSPKYVDLFGEQIGELNREGELNFKSRTKMTKEASITCSGIGAEKTGQHYDVAIFDDLSSMDNCRSPEQRKKVIDHYRLYTSLLEPQGSIMVGIGTRYHEEDIIGHILTSEIGIDQHDF